MISFMPLFHTMLDKGVSSSQLCKRAKLSTATLSNMRHNKSITTNVLARICAALDCAVSDVIAFVPDGATNSKGGSDET